MPRKTDVPASAVRDFLRQAAQLPEWDTRFIRSVLGLDPKAASEVLNWMQMLGHIELVSSKKSTWRNTQAGNALIGVKLGKPLKRETIQQALNEFAERIRKVNTSPDYAYAVTQAILFGPYYTTEADVRSADVAVTLRPKRSNTAPVVNSAEAKKSRMAVIRALKGKGRSLAVFEGEDWILKQPHRLLFQTAST